MEDSKDKVYSDDGCLIVSELGKCPFFEKDSSFVRLGYDEDCFFCKFSDFSNQVKTIPVKALYIAKAIRKP